MPFGIVGGRLYHVTTDPELYFAPGQQPVRALYIWDGGLGIWGAVALGALGDWIGCRRHGIALPAFADTPGPRPGTRPSRRTLGQLVQPRALRRPSTLPWALEIDPAHRPPDTPLIATYQPTFLYESLWDIGVAILLIWAGKRWVLDNGRLFALYVAAYTVGRAWIEALRIDHANHFLGLRRNDWTSVAVLLAAISFLVFRPRQAGRGHPRPRPRLTRPATSPRAEPGGTTQQCQPRTVPRPAAFRPFRSAVRT